MTKLESAALSLYFAGRWECSVVDPQRAAKLWADLRDALGLAEGSATSVGVGTHAPPGAGGGFWRNEPSKEGDSSTHDILTPEKLAQILNDINRRLGGVEARLNRQEKANVKAFLRDEYGG